MIEKTLEINDSFYTFLYLLMCGVEGKPPSSELLREMNMEDVYQISVYHTLSAMTYMVLEKGQDILEGEVFKNWKKEKDKAIRKNILLDRERENICFYGRTGDMAYATKGNHFKRNVSGIWYAADGR